MNSILIDPSTSLGPIKPMNAVNNGPLVARKDQTRGNLLSFQALHIPFARVHDAAFCAAYGGEHTVDISAVFPRFEADPDDPASYDFTLTDRYMEAIRLGGAEPFYRLGSKIEHLPKKYGILPPPDFKKWAVVCEHIVRHLNEGWADGHHYGIRYWEIWNEPDLAWEPTVPLEDKKTWTGTPEQFFDLFKVSARHLKQCFPDLKIGGPAVCSPIGNGDWTPRFLNAMANDPEGRVPMDFFSWHTYCNEPKWIAHNAREVRKMLDAAGYTDTESHCNEWNYVRGWTDDWIYSIRSMIGIKGAAFQAAVMADCQNAPVDMLMYYDARPCAMNGIWNQYDLSPLKGWYALDAFRALADLGRLVRTQIDETDGGEELHAVAAKCRRNGRRRAALIARFVEDDAVTRPKAVALRLASGTWGAHPRVRILDAKRDLADIPADVRPDGTLRLRLPPLSAALVEW